MLLTTSKACSMGYIPWSQVIQPFLLQGDLFTCLTILASKWSLSNLADVQKSMVKRS